LEGSRDYQSLLGRAQEYYINHRDSVHCEPTVGQEILDLLNSVEYSVEEFKKAESSLPNVDGKLTFCRDDLF
jgi:hypothetical protein